MKVQRRSLRHLLEKSENVAPERTIKETARAFSRAAQPEELQRMHKRRHRVVPVQDDDCLVRLGVPVFGLIFTGRNKKPNRTGKTEPNRTEPFNSGTGRNRTRKRTEPNRTEPDWTERRYVKKTQAELRRTGKNNCPNRTEPIRTEPNRLIVEKSRTETNRTEPVPSCMYCLSFVVFIACCMIGFLHVCLIVWCCCFCLAGSTCAGIRGLASFSESKVSLRAPSRFGPRWSRTSRGSSAAPLEGVLLPSYCQPRGLIYIYIYIYI